MLDNVKITRHSRQIVVTFATDCQVTKNEETAGTSF